MIASLTASLVQGRSIANSSGGGTVNVKSSFDLNFFSRFGGTVDTVEDFLDGQACFPGGAERGVFEAGIYEVAEFISEQRREVGFGGDPAGGFVHHRAGVVGEDGGGIPVGAALVAHEVEVPDVFFDVGGEGGFEVQEGAVVEADLADREIFAGVRFLVPVVPHGGDNERRV